MQSTSLPKTLNTHSSEYKSRQNETDSLSQRCYLPQSATEKEDKCLFYNPFEKDVPHSMNTINPSYDTVQEKSEQLQREEKEKENESKTTPSQLSKKAAVSQTQLEQTLKLKKGGKVPIVTMAMIETPRNALVLYWGRMCMTAKELRHKNLSRCIDALLEEDHYEFVLLKMQEKKLVLQYCSTSKNEEPDEKVTKSKRKKSLTETIRNNGRDLRKRQPRDDNVQLLHERRGSKGNFFACIGLSGSSSRYQNSLKHNDSLSLKSYQLLKRKKLLEFDYRNIVYCGVEERGIPNNMLVWICHTEYGNYSAVEFQCVECDDQSHARQLSRGIKHEIAKVNGW